jgi:hypothetical protein
LVFAGCKIILCFFTVYFAVSKTLFTFAAVMTKMIAHTDIILSPNIIKYLVASDNLLTHTHTHTHTHTQPAKAARESYKDSNKLFKTARELQGQLKEYTDFSKERSNVSEEHSNVLPFFSSKFESEQVTRQNSKTHAR